MGREIRGPDVSKFGCKVFRNSGVRYFEFGVQVFREFRVGGLVLFGPPGASGTRRHARQEGSRRRPHRRHRPGSPGAYWVLGAISWHRYSGTATHEGDERVSTTEKRARATHDKGEAFQCLTSSLLILVLPPSPSLPPPSSFFPSSLAPSLLPSLPRTLAPFPPSLLPFPPSLHSSLILLLAREAAGPPASQPPQRRGGLQRLGGHGPGSAVKLG